MIISQQNIVLLIKDFLYEKIRSKKGFSMQKMQELSDAYFAGSRHSLGMEKAARTLYRYLDEHLQFIGAGSSRSAFVLSSKYVLKLAYGKYDQDHTKTGLKQNEHEVLVSKTSPQILKIIPNVIKYDPRFVWIISELVREMNESDFNKLTGLEFRQFCIIIMELDNLRPGLSDVEFTKELESITEDFHIPPVNHEIEKFLKSILQLIGTGRLQSSDLIDITQWGKTADGRAVILDYGLSNEIYHDSYIGF